MLKKIVIGLFLFVALVIGGGKLYIEYMDRQMDATPLVTRLAATPIPADGLVLVSEWNHDGSWLIKPREPEASRVYLTAMPVDRVCEHLDVFYAEAGVRSRPIQRSDDPRPWCGRRLETALGDITVSVESADGWRELPAELTGEETVAQVLYSAHR